MTEDLGQDGGRSGGRSGDERWEPLLEGARAAHARAVAGEIVVALERQPPSAEPGFQGDASIALLLAHCGRPTAGPRLESALNAIAARPATISLFAGISGMSWLVDHLAGGDEAESIIAHFDAAILRYLDRPRWHERYDLVTGLVGAGIAAAGHRGEHTARIAERVVSHLEALADVGEAGATWRTPPQLLGDTRHARSAGVIDLGVAHGVPGVIGMLAQFVDADIERERSRRLLQAAVAWLLHTVPRGRPRFGARWPTDPDEVKRTGWCHGDPGVAGVLLRASRTLGSADLEHEALQLLQPNAAPGVARPIPDACICHGAAGVAHIYNVAFQRTGSVQLRAQAEHWIGEVLRARTPGTGIAGYRFLTFDGDEPRWASDTTLVSGAAGVALVLLAAVEDRAPAWQGLFLL
jgi:lantibiotic modifying enzyme